MHPILFELGPFTVTGYGTAMVVAILVGWWLTQRVARRLLPSVVSEEELWLDLYFGLILGGLLGAKVLLILVEWPELISGEVDFVSLALAGGVWLGGVAGAVAFGAWFVHRHRLPTARVVDTLVTGLPLAHAIGRAGCLLAGCCYGAACELPWAITYTDPAAHEIAGTPLGVPLHPSPIYEMLAELFNFTVLLAILRRRPKPWTLTATWALLYGTERFFLEFLRGDSRGALATWSTSQWICAVLVALGIFLLWRRPGAKAEGTI
ncbi:MAG: prolipoprotein diacylglyceryl transferase [Acidobacteriota bacterium]